MMTSTMHAAWHGVHVVSMLCNVPGRTAGGRANQFMTTLMHQCRNCRYMDALRRAETLPQNT